MHSELRKYLSTIGRQGGLKSRRILSPQAAKQMVQVREAKRAFKNFHKECFAGHNPNMQIVAADIPWIIKKLIASKNGAASKLAEKLSPHDEPFKIRSSVIQQRAKKYSKTWKDRIGWIDETLLLIQQAKTNRL